ncbi:MAG TPA: hypothetical protein VF746_01450 [Longimicrobium sp.]|jgi:hypothetical protein
MAIHRTTAALLFLALAACARSEPDDPPAASTARADTPAAASPAPRGAPAAVDTPPSYVGLRIPPGPAGVRMLGGYVVEPQKSMDYTVDHRRDAAGDMLWLARTTGHDAQGRPSLEVLAVQRIPPLAQGDTVILGPQCAVGDASGGGDDNTVAVVAYEEAAILTRVRHAWRVDVEGRRFVPLPPGGVQCMNEGFGEGEAT